MVLLYPPTTAAEFGGSNMEESPRHHDGLLIEPVRGPQKPKGSNGIILPVGIFFKNDIYESELIECEPYSLNNHQNRQVGAALVFAMEYVNSDLCKNSVDNNLLAFYKNMRFSEILLSKNRAAKVINWKLYRHHLRSLESNLSRNHKLNKELMDRDAPMWWEKGERRDNERIGPRSETTRNFLMGWNMTPGEKINEIFSAWLQLKSACKVKVSPYYKSNYDNVKKHAVLERLIVAKKPHFRTLAEQHARQFLTDHGMDKSIFEQKKILTEGESE
jgi:hypothetical protein